MYVRAVYAYKLMEQTLSIPFTRRGGIGEKARSYGSELLADGDIDTTMVWDIPCCVWTFGFGSATSLFLSFLFLELCVWIGSSAP